MVVLTKMGLVVLALSTGGESRWAEGGYFFHDEAGDLLVTIIELCEMDKGFRRNRPPPRSGCDF